MRTHSLELTEDQGNVVGKVLVEVLSNTILLNKLGISPEEIVEILHEMNFDF